uniref:ATP synthase complex subunit 8 n=2 Tax=Scorpaenopsis TaxID=163119 RepID=A0A679DN66_9TELE|nr:ATP synthase F0 subunit 8 [Scorpaenopsis cirrosa]AKT94796.1 ATP synthase subunit 8 [Scorpaenopsis cirrosa]BBM34751.1 ATPase subunit 8 [Scorpaenopsis ramaraoi]
MPQLNPKPWLLILVFSWLCLLTLVPLKVTSHLFVKPGKTQVSAKQSKDGWTWPWS